MRAPVKLGIPAALAAMAGCATEIPVRPQGDSAGNQGGAWEVVFPMEATARELDAGPEYARRDASLNPQSTEPLIGLNSWPEPYRPNLDQARRLSLPRDGDRVLYLSPNAWPTHYYRRRIYFYP